MPRRMDKQKFEHILATHGSSPDRWPDADRAAALQFCATAPQAAAMLREARALDTLISALPDIGPSPELSARITAAAFAQSRTAELSLQDGQLSIAADYRRRMRRLREGLWPFGPLWRPAAGLALPALFGLLLGLYQPQQILTPGSAPGAGARPAAITLTSAAASTSATASDGNRVQAPTYDLTELAFASLDPLESFVMTDAGFLPASATPPQTQHIVQQPVQHNATNATVDAPVATANDTVSDRTTKLPEPQQRSATLPADPAAGPAPNSPPDRAISPPATPAIPALPQPGHRGTPGSALGFSPSPSGGQGGWR